MVSLITFSNNYGVVEEGLAVDDNDGAVVPENRLELSNEHFQLLQQHVDPLANSDNHGIELYGQTVEFIINL